MGATVVTGGDTPFRQPLAEGPAVIAPVADRAFGRGQVRRQDFRSLAVADLAGGQEQPERPARTVADGMELEI